MTETDNGAANSENEITENSLTEAEGRSPEDGRTPDETADNLASPGSTATGAGTSGGTRHSDVTGGSASSGEETGGYGGPGVEAETTGSDDGERGASDDRGDTTSDGSGAGMGDATEEPDLVDTGGTTEADVSDGRSQ